mmetsp:Transcript_32673/g.64003  ORF Transcript_32673/g.64003 Transcript_32673/m.64003 type:complete len:211 (+) Transcript_32673:237-869(+)
MGVVGEVGGLEALSGGTAAATKRFWAACTANSFVPAGEKANEDKPKLGSCDPPPTKLKGCIAVAPEAEKKTWTREVAKSDTNSSSSCVELSALTATPDGLTKTPLPMASTACGGTSVYVYAVSWWFLIERGGDSADCAPCHTRTLTTRPLPVSAMKTTSPSEVLCKAICCATAGTRFSANPLTRVTTAFVWSDPPSPWSGPKSYLTREPY